MSLRHAALSVPLLLVLAIPATAGAASASGGGGVIASGTCSIASTWKLKAKLDNGRVDVEADVDSNRVGQKWAWALLDNGVKFASGTATTVAPSGSFSVNRLTANRAGTDKIVFKASTASTGETCRGVVSLG